MELIERAEQLGELAAHFEQCVKGRGGLALIKGGPSAGKTALLHGFHQSVLGTGATVLTATGARAEQGLRLGLMRQLFGRAQLPPDLAERVRAVLTDRRSERDGAQRRTEPSGPAGDGARPWDDAHAMDTLSQALLELASRAPVVMSVDDVHFGDPESLQALLYCRRRIPTARVLIVLTAWDRSRTGNASFHAEITRHPHARVRVTRLSGDGVEELVAKRVGTMSSAGTELDHHALTRGNPLLLHALIDDQLAGLTRTRTGPEDAASWPAFVQAVTTCMYRWDPALFTVARGYAVLGAEATAHQVAHLVDARVELVEESMEILTAAGLGTGQTLHPAIAAAVLGDVEPAGRTALHARAAELLHEGGAHPLVTARHLLAADRALTPGGIGVLRAGAEHALVDDDLELAVRCLTLALRECADEEERLAIGVALGRLEWQTNPSSAAVRLAALRTERPGRSIDPRRGAAIVRALLWAGDRAAANEVFDGFRHRLDELDPQTLGSLRHTDTLVYGAPGRGLPAELHRQHRTGIAAALHPDDAPEARPAKAAGLGTVRAAERLLATSPLDEGTLEALAKALLALIKGDEVLRAVGPCEALLKDSVRRGATTWQTVFHSIRADIALRLGDVPDAVRHARTALQRIETCGPAPLVGYPLGVLVLAHSAVGDHEAAADALRRVVPERMFETVFGLSYLHARGHHRLKAGRLLEALHDIETCGKLAREWGVDVPTFLPWRNELALVHLTFGNRQSAHRLLSEQLALPTGVDLRTQGLSLRLLAESEEPRNRPRLLKKSVRLLESAGDRFELFRSLDVLGRSYEEMGELDQARSVARRAKQEAPRWHATRQQHNGAGRAGRAEPEATEAPPLSEAEHRVATLAAQGYTNREIGRQLHITISTVEQHLTRVYRKLKVSRRTDLPQAAHGAAPPGDDEGDAAARAS
ncbi:AAA family ATPase [Streptomyces sp. NPDC047315]|uniref:AAA family ATPase n=1 Tax=Streptomyces sp. NPDC047315 TaxID=3155142 RepID=UPI0033F97D66